MILEDFLQMRASAAHPLQGHLTFRGLQISIENRKGSVRSGVTDDGKKWSTKMKFPYGYIKKTEGVDGDHVDCFVGPDVDAEKVYVIHTRRPPKFTQYDEDKAMLGFRSRKQARKAFQANYDNTRFFGSMDVMAFDDFKKKVLRTKVKPRKITADASMAPAVPIFHMEPITRMHPPSLRNPSRVPADNPQEKRNKFLDYMKRRSRSVRWYRDSITKRSAPSSPVAVRTTVVAPHSGVFIPFGTDV